MCTDACALIIVFSIVIAIIPNHGTLSQTKNPAVIFLESFFYVSVLAKCVRAMKIVREYDQEIPQSQNADNPVAPRGKATQPSRDTRKTN